MTRRRAYRRLVIDPRERLTLGSLVLGPVPPRDDRQPPSGSATIIPPKER